MANISINVTMNKRDKNRRGPVQQKRVSVGFGTRCWNITSNYLTHQVSQSDDRILQINGYLESESGHLTFFLSVLPLVQTPARWLRNHESEAKLPSGWWPGIRRWPAAPQGGRYLPTLARLQPGKCTHELQHSSYSTTTAHHLQGSNHRALTAAQQQLHTEYSTTTAC